MFDYTAGSATANSYVSVEYCDDYIDTRLNASEWLAATDALKQSALVTATGTVEENFQWRGEPATTTQALHWPAEGAINCRGEEISSTTIPEAVKRAVCEQALYLLKFDATQTPTAIMQGLSQASVGSLSATFDALMTPETVQGRVKSILRCYGQMIGSNGSSEASGAYIGRG